MKKAYQYLYYRSYDLLSLTGTYDLAWGASHFMALILGVLTMRVLFFYGELLNVFTMGIFGVGSFLSLHILNYFVFLKNNRCREIVKQYAKETSTTKKLGRLILVITVAALIYSLF